MKIMISIPMNGKNNDEIRKDMQKYIDKFDKLHIDVIDSLLDNVAGLEYYNKPGLYYIGKSIDIIGKVDAVFFANGWEDSPGCIIEREVCKMYNVKILDENFLESNKPQEIKPNMSLEDNKYLKYLKNVTKQYRTKNYVEPFEITEDLIIAIEYIIFVLNMIDDFN